METKPITTEEVWQQVREFWFNLAIATDPSFVQNYYVTNMVTPALSILFAKAGSRIVPVEATGSGQLKVAIAAAGFEHNLTIAKFLVTDAYAVKQFSQVVSRVDITTWDYSVIIQRRPYAEAAWESEIELVANGFYSFDCTSQAIYIKNAVPGSAASCQIVGWY